MDNLIISCERETSAIDSSYLYKRGLRCVVGATFLCRSSEAFTATPILQRKGNDLYRHSVPIADGDRMMESRSGAGVTSGPTGSIPPRRDRRMNLDYLNARYYDSARGQFLSG